MDLLDFFYDYLTLYCKSSSFYFAYLVKLSALAYKNGHNKVTITNVCRLFKNAKK